MRNGIGWARKLWDWRRQRFLFRLRASLAKKAQIRRSAKVRIKKASTARPWQQARSLAAEDAALLFLTSHHPLEFVRSRWKTPFGEVDLVLRNSRDVDHLVLVEIKTLRSMEHLQTRVKKRQIQRLTQVAEWLTGSDQRVELWFAFVRSDGQVLVLKSDEMNI